MEELGHGVGAGWLDDQAAAVGECYSGRYSPDTTACYATAKLAPNLSSYVDLLDRGNSTEILIRFRGSQDQTPEYITRGGNQATRWSIMSLDPNRQRGQYFVFSIEEASTVDLVDLPEREEDD